MECQPEPRQHIICPLGATLPDSGPRDALGGEASTKVIIRQVLYLLTNEDEVICRSESKIVADCCADILYLHYLMLPTEGLLLSSFVSVISLIRK